VSERARVLVFSLPSASATPPADGHRSSGRLAGHLATP
jgi:hypothetical protein